VISPLVNLGIANRASRGDTGPTDLSATSQLAPYRWRSWLMS